MRNQPNDASVFAALESEVRYYCRRWPAVFAAARGHEVIDEAGERYIDFFSGAGALNYGHNNPGLKRVVLDYIENDGIVHSLDMFSSAKRDFLAAFDEYILQPAGLNYRVMFTGPTGADAVEAAIRLARLVTGRPRVISFAAGYHGMTQGTLGLGGYRSLDAADGSATAPEHTVLPFGDANGSEKAAQALDRLSGQADAPAAIIVETVQAEGGVNVAAESWLRQLAAFCQKNDVLMIIDDIQVGCGRTGPFFSFTPSGIRPDMVVLSKSLSGYGLPLSVVLIRPELDVWRPGQHTGTFRGQNLSFVSAAEALRLYWKDQELRDETARKGRIMCEAMRSTIANLTTEICRARGKGMIVGFEVSDSGRADAIVAESFRRGLLVESVGREKNVLKLAPPLTIPEAELRRGLDLLAASIECTLSGSSSSSKRLQQQSPDTPVRSRNIAIRPRSGRRPYSGTQPSTLAGEFRGMTRLKHCLDFSLWDGYLLPLLWPDCRRIEVATDRAPGEVEALLQEPNPGAIALHIDLTDCGRLPIGREQLCEQFQAAGWTVVNHNLQSIAKRAIHAACAVAGIPTAAATRIGDPSERLIVKTNRNHGGKPEAVWNASALRQLGIAPRPPVWQKDHGYRLATRSETAAQDWEDDQYVVERYIDNPLGRFHRLYVAGSRAAFSTAVSDLPIKTIGAGKDRENFLMRWPPDSQLDAPSLLAETGILTEAYKLLTAIGMEFGAVDIAEDSDGQLFIIDVTGTPHWGDEDAPDVLHHLRPGL